MLGQAKNKCLSLSQFPIIYVKYRPGQTIDMSVFFVYCLCKRIFSSFCNTMKAHKNFKKIILSSIDFHQLGQYAIKLKNIALVGLYENMQFFMLSANKHLQDVILTIFFPFFLKLRKIERKTSSDASKNIVQEFEFYLSRNLDTPIQFQTSSCCLQLSSCIFLKRELLTYSQDP